MPPLSEDGGLVECPCCHGKGYLWLHDASFPDEPPRRVVCCHCTNGVIAMDNRSLNTNE